MEQAANNKRGQQDNGVDEGQKMTTDQQSTIDESGKSRQGCSCEDKGLC
jgi:hypothetical protein